jgi:hypothetical protein
VRDAATEYVAGDREGRSSSTGDGGTTTDATVGVRRAVRREYA